MPNPLDENEPVQNNGFINRVMRTIPQRSWRTWLLGNPLPTADAPHQTVSKTVGLAVFGADALPSIAYAPQETLVILAGAGTQASGYAFPISLVITILLAIVMISYLQTIHAYPSGGGAYTVVKENLRIPAALVAGAALLMDYVLLGLIAVANLRGVKESGNTFVLSTYFFLVMTALTGWGKRRIYLGNRQCATVQAK